MSLLYNRSKGIKMGLMAIEDQQRRQQMVAQAPPKKGMSRRFAITGIVVLLVLNAGAVYWLYAQAKASANSITSATSNSSRFTLPGISSSASLPTSDVAGEDLAGLQRYKGAVRTKFDNSSGVTTIEYQSKDPASTILGFYKSELAQNDWILLYSSPTKIIFSQGDKKITIEVAVQNGVTTFTVTT
jgi:hypothetical protein